MLVSQSDEYADKAEELVAFQEKLTEGWGWVIHNQPPQLDQRVSPVCFWKTALLPTGK